MMQVVLSSKTVSSFLRSTWPSEQSHLFQKRHGLRNSLSIERIQSLGVAAVEVAERAMQPVSWYISWVHDVRLRRRRAQKNEAGTLMSPAEALQ